MVGHVDILQHPAPARSFPGRTHKAEQDQLEKPKTLIVNMSYMVMNTMQRDPLQPRGQKPSLPRGPGSPPTPGEEMKGRVADGEASA